MAFNQFVLATVVVCLMALCEFTQAKRSEDVLPRPSRNKNGDRDQRNPERQELFAGLKDPESSAQGVSTSAINPYNQLGNQGLVNAGGGLYAGGIGQSQNPYALAGFGGGLQQNPYLGLGGGLGGVGGYQQNPYLGVGGLGAGGYQNPYALGGTGGIGGIGGYSGLGGGLQNQYLGLQNPYLQTGAGGLQDIYSQQGGIGLGNQYLGGGLGGQGVNPYLFRNLQVGQGYLGQNPYISQGAYLSQGLLNPYTSYGQLNPYNSFPLSSRFGLGLSRGTGGRTTSSSQQTSNSDE